MLGLDNISAVFLALCSLDPHQYGVRPGLSNFPFPLEDYIERMATSLGGRASRIFFCFDSLWEIYLVCRDFVKDLFRSMLDFFWPGYLLQANTIYAVLAFNKKVCILFFCFVIVCLLLSENICWTLCYFCEFQLVMSPCEFHKVLHYFLRMGLWEVFHGDFGRCLCVA